MQLVHTKHKLYYTNVIVSVENDDPPRVNIPQFITFNSLGVLFKLYATKFAVCVRCAEILKIPIKLRKDRRKQAMDDDTIISGSRVALRENNNMMSTGVTERGGTAVALQSTSVAIGDSKQFQDKDDNDCLLRHQHDQQAQVRHTTKLLAEIGKARDGNILVSAPKRFIRRIRDSMTPVAASTGDAYSAVVGIGGSDEIDASSCQASKSESSTVLSKRFAVSADSYQNQKLANVDNRKRKDLLIRRNINKADSEPVTRKQHQHSSKVFGNSLTCEKENSIFPCNSTTRSSIKSEICGNDEGSLSDAKQKKNTQKFKSYKSTGAVPDIKSANLTPSTIAESFNLKRFFSRTITTINKEVQTDVFDEPLTKKVLTDKDPDISRDELTSDNVLGFTYWKLLANERLVEIESLTRENEELHDLVENLTTELKDQSETVKELLIAVDNEFAKQEEN
ncbi:hypothetical protein GJ496_001147 [Pomphorhynchus laevis]|nr:hypothetical protein GJ496_001147 [Pomphorhynchus laevis]